MINDRFVIKRKLGEGRSKVFLCADLDNDGKEFAIKILNKNADEEEIKSFRDEFFTLQKLNHPNIIAAHEEGAIVKVDENENDIAAGTRYILLDFFPGSELLKFPIKDNEEILKKIITQICSVLYYLHQSNYIYYDLKPENILIDINEDDVAIKIIDMGLAYHSTLTDESLSRGTAKYIAPEILKKEPHNHLVDLYSLGILLYKIVWNKFPFETGNQLEIYKAHIEKEFEFPKTNFSGKLVDVIRNLLSKNPTNRYSNSLQVINQLGVKISAEIYKDFLPSSVFAGRTEEISAIDNILNDQNNKEIILISGSEGSGKTSLVNELYKKYNNTVFVSGSSEKRGIDFILNFLKKIIFSDFVYMHLSPNVLKESAGLITNPEQINIDSLKAVINKISTDTSFILVIDDFNFLDEFSFELLKDILPILQVNNCKVILTENTDKSSISEFVHNYHQINLTAFDQDELNEYLDKAFTAFFPKDQLKNLITNHADLLPGSIEVFIKDLVLMQIIEFTPEGPEINTDEKTVQLLQSSQEEIFKIRLDLLTDEEITIAHILSSFEIAPDINVLSELAILPGNRINSNIVSMIEKNILQQASVFTNPSFTSESLKRYIYSAIGDKQKLHKIIASILYAKFRDYNRTESARHFELAEEYEESYKIYLDELKEAEKLFAFSYQQKILSHLLTIPLPDKIKKKLNYRLCKVLHKLNDSKSAVELIDKIINSFKEDELEELLTIKGICLINLGDIEDGKKILEELAEVVNDTLKKQKLLVEIAYAEFDLGRYDTARSICFEVINNTDTPPEEKGKCYNLLGLLDTYMDNNLESALSNFQEGLEIYQTTNLILNVAKIAGNIGNTYFWKGDYLNAEKHWNDSLQLNTSAGNLDQEGRVLLSFGIFYYNQTSFEKAINHYLRANDIFLSLGNRNGQGLVLSNLGETYLTKCEYQNAFESLNKAKDIFKNLSNIEEETEVLFLLGKLFFILGDIELLTQVINDIKLLAEGNDLPERHINNFRYLELLSQLNKGNPGISMHSVYKSFNDFKEQNEGLFFAEGHSLLCECLINNAMYNEVYDLLKDEKFEIICNQNFLIKAGKKYFNGLLALSDKSFKLPPPVDSFSEAYELIRDEHVTELTWKVLFSLGENYYVRGNFNKANDLLFYSGEVINFIADKIKDPEIKKIYLSKPNRKSTFEKIKEMIKKQ